MKTPFDRSANNVAPDKDFAFGGERMRALKEAYQSVVNGVKPEDSLKLLSQLTIQETTGEVRTAFYVADATHTTLHPMLGVGSMPDAYLREVGSFPIGKESGGSGFAIRSDQPAISADVFEDPLWKPWRHLAEKFEFRACWSFQINADDESVLGMFSMYFRTRREPTQQELSTAEIVTHAAAVIMAHHTANVNRAKAEEAMTQTSEEHRKSEERLRRAITTARTVVWEWDVLHNKIETTSNFEDIYGLSSIRFAEQGYNLLDPHDREAHLAKVQKAATLGGGYFSQFRIIRPDTKETIWLEERADSVVDTHGNVVKLVGASIDITDLKKTEQLLKDLNGRLQEIDKAKTNFFNNVSHEFRTPLTLLISPLEDVIKSEKSKLTQDDLQKLRFSYRSAIRLQKLVNTLLDFARIENGKLEAFYQPTDFAQTTVELAGNFRSAIEKAGLKFVVKKEDIAEPVYLNREMWEKIVFNLLSNAFKFTQQGRIEVIIREKKKNVELRVKDSGVGIAPKNIDRIFERFARIEGVKARTYEGTGIGLSLVQELASSHGGSIKVKSIEGIGSEFIVSIPKGKSHLPKHQIYESRDRLPGRELKQPFLEEASGWLPEDLKSLKRKLRQYQRNGAARILIAEDNADMREYLRTVLAEDHYHILAVEDGQKVLSFLNEGGDADLILADVMMPRMDGFEMVRVLKANSKYSDIPIVLLSAKSSEDAKIEGLAVGADDYLVKPSSTKELRAIISARIRRSAKYRHREDSDDLRTRA